MYCNGVLLLQIVIHRTKTLNSTVASLDLAAILDFIIAAIFEFDIYLVICSKQQTYNLSRHIHYGHNSQLIKP